MREESHLDDMRAAIRGDFERLAERRGGQGLMRTSEDDTADEGSEAWLPVSEPEATPELAPAPEAEDAPVTAPEPEPEDASAPVSEPAEDFGEPSRRSWLARLFGG